MSTLAKKLSKKNIRDLVPYASARRSMSGGDIWLNANESPFANEYSLDSSVLNRYPDFQPASLIKAYADYAKVKPNQVLASRGADEAIELLIRTFCENDEKILVCPPTYGMYAISAQTCGIEVKKVPLQQDFSLDIDAIKAAKDQVKLIFICSPNNPTGSLVAHQQIKQVLEIFKDSAIVAVDEAYIEYAPEHTVASWLDEYPNLAVMRTLSKAFGLAGLRCGFTLANQHIIEALQKVIPPYPISWPVAQIACQALSAKGLSIMQTQRSEVLKQKARLIEALQEADYIYEQVESAANFIMFRSHQKKALFDAFIAAGILIRDYSGQVMLDNSLRISIGSQQDTDAVIAVLKAFKG